MRKILIIQLSILIVLFCATPTLSQETPKTDSVNASRTIQAAANGDGETVCDRRLLKTLDALEAAESVAASLKSEIESLRRLAAVNDEIIKAKETVIAEQKKLIEILEKKSRRRISFFFGMVKVSY